MLSFKKTIKIILISSVCFLYSCVVNQSVEKTKYITTSSGLQYKITKKAKGNYPQKGDNLIIHYVGKLNNDSIFENTYNRKTPILFKIGENQIIAGLEEGLFLMKQGEKASFIIPSELAYGDEQKGLIPANSVLIFDVELIKIEKNQKVKPFDIKRKSEKQTPSGLKYVVVKSTNGARPLHGSKVTINYSGYLTDGTLFDSSIQNGVSFSFSTSDEQILAGWREGIALMRIGEMYRFYIPYNLGYGEYGLPPIIPPKSNLIFDIELLSIDQ